MQVRDINIQCNIKQFMYRQMKTKKLSVCVYVCVSKMFYFNVIFLGGGGGLTVGIFVMISILIHVVRKYNPTFYSKAIYKEVRRKGYVCPTDIFVYR